MVFYFALFLAGFTIGIFSAMKIFSLEKYEDEWDPQNLQIPSVETDAYRAKGNASELATT